MNYRSEEQKLAAEFLLSKGFAHTESMPSIMEKKGYLPKRATITLKGEVYISDLSPKYKRVLGQSYYESLEVLKKREDFHWH